MENPRGVAGWRMVVVAASILSFAHQALTAPPEDAQWDDRFGPIGVDRQIRAITNIGSDLYVAGEFTAAGGIPASNIARWDGRRWAALGTGLNLQANALATDGTSLFVGGAFTTVGGASMVGIARWDGTQWLPLGSGLKAAGMQVFALTSHNGLLYAGGQFTSIGGVTTRGIAQWDGTQWSDVGGGIAGDVHSLVFQGNDLVVGGAFPTAGGVTAKNIARWDGHVWSPLGTGISGASSAEVDALAVVGNDLFAAGTFTTAGAATVANIARWDGVGWNALGAGLTGGSGSPKVGALLAMGTDLFAAGSFTTAGGAKASAIARWDGGSWSILGNGTFGTGTFSAPSILALAADGATLLVGGKFSTADVISFISDIQPNNLARWDGQQWTGIGLGIGGTGTSEMQIHALKTDDTGIFVGGSLGSVAGLHTKNIAHWDGTRLTVLGTGVTDANGQGFVSAIEVADGQVYVGGRFSKAGNTAVSNVARWNGTDWVGLGNGFDNQVGAMAQAGGSIYAGGIFAKSGTTPVAGVARFDGAQWVAVGGGLSGSPVNVLVMRGSGQDLYVGGQFRKAGGGDALNIAKWNGTSWSALGPGLGQAGAQFDAVQAIQVSADGKFVYASGQFPSAGAAGNQVSRWDGNSWTVLGSGDAFADALALVGDDLYVGGGFTKISGVPAMKIARFSGGVWTALGDGVTGQLPTVYALEAKGTDLFVGGLFEFAGAKRDERFGIYHTLVTAPAPTISISDVTVTEGNQGNTDAVFAVTLSATATQPVSVAFATTDGTAVASSDYQSAQGTLTFAVGETSKNITVPVVGDTGFEANESFFVDLSQPVNATLSKPRGTATITNDDAPLLPASGIQFTGQQFGVSVPTVTGVTYILESRSDLVLGDWAMVMSVTGDGTVKLLQDAAATSDTQFYRLRVTFP